MGQHWPDEPYPRAPWLRRALAGPLARSIVWSAFSVVIVAALVAVVWAAAGRDTGGGSPLSGPADGRTAGSLSPSATSVPTQALPTTTVPTSSASHPARPRTRPARPSAAPPAHSPSRAASSPPVVLEPPLLVLNNSRIPGLAAKAAGDLRGVGWPIAGTGNVSGRLPRTTVFFAPGQEAAARYLMARSRYVEQALPRPAWLPGTGLTLVVTRYYPH